MFNFSVNPDDGNEYELTAQSRDVYKWEKQFKGRSLGTLMNEVNMKALYEIAYIAAKRQGKCEGSLDDFVDSNDIEFTNQSDMDPTQ